MSSEREGSELKRAGRVAAAVVIRQAQEFDTAMDQLRLACFPEEGWDGTARDAYDGDSLHVCIDVDGCLSAYARLTPAIHGYFRDKLGPAVHLPPERDAVDLGRIVVRPAHRGHLLFERLVVEALLVAASRGFGYVVGTARPDRRFLPLFDELRLRRYGAPVQAKTHLQTCLLQPLLAATAGATSAWETRRAELDLRLLDAGYRVTT